MNLLARSQKGLAVILILFLASCEQENDTALDIEIENATEVLSSNLDVPMYTVFVDSMRTDVEDNAAVGSFTDNDLGKITATSFHTMRYTEGTIPRDTSVFDSLVLQIDITGRLENNERGGFYFIHELEEEIYNSVVYLADKEIKKNEIPIDTLNSNFALLNDTIVKLKLPKLGFKLFNLVQDSASLVGFEYQFAISPSEDLKSLITFNTDSDSTKLILYSSIDTIQSTTEFTLNAKHFTNLKRDFSGTRFEGIQSLDSISYDGENALLAPLYGFYPVVNFKEYLRFVDTSEDLIINKAEILIQKGDESVNPSASFEFFFFKENSGFTGEGLLGTYENWIRTAILDNQSYFPPRPSNITAKASEEEGIYTTDVTIFTDIYLRQFRSEEKEILTEYLVIAPEDILTTQETYLVSDPFLKILFTVVRP